MCVLFGDLVSQLLDSAVNKYMPVKQKPTQS